MKTSDIEVGKTYMFVATDNPTRAYLVGQPFKVEAKRAVFRRVRKGKKKVYRFFNEDGVGARPEELGEMPANSLFTPGCDAILSEKYEACTPGNIPEREFPCPNCDTGELIHNCTTPTNHGSTLHYECNECGYMCSYP